MRPPENLPDAIETERLILRRPEPEHAPAVHGAMCESWAALAQWIPWAQTRPEPPPLGEIVASLEEKRAEYEAGTAFHFNAFLRDGGAFVGRPLLIRLDWEVPKGEVGYWMRSAYEGRGLMTEAVAAVTAFALDTLGMARVEIRCDPRNGRSAAIARRLGYLLEGVLRNDYREPDGSFSDTAVYSLIPGDPWHRTR